MATHPWPPIPKIPAIPNMYKDDPFFSPEFRDALSETLKRDAEYETWLDALPEILMASKKDPALRDLLEQAYMLYCLKHKGVEKC